MRRGRRPGRRGKGSKVGKLKNKGFDRDDRVVRGEGILSFPLFASHLLLMGQSGCEPFLSMFLKG